MRVFVVQHVHVVGDDQEDVKLIGIYSSEDLARSAVARLSQVEGFADGPEGFNVDAYEMDEDYWAEGFRTVNKP